MCARPWTNLEKQEDVQIIKARSDQLRDPLKADMANDEIKVRPGANAPRRAASARACAPPVPS